MVTMDPPDSTNFLSCGMVLSSLMRPMPAAILLGNRFRIWRAAATAAAASASAAAGRRIRAVGEHQHVELALQIARVERLRIHHLERKFVLLEQPARPAGRHDAAVLIVEADADRLQLQRLARRAPSPPRARERRIPSRA